MKKKELLSYNTFLHGVSLERGIVVICLTSVEPDARGFGVILAKIWQQKIRAYWAKCEGS